MLDNTNKALQWLIDVSCICLIGSKTKPTFSYCVVFNF